MARARYADAVLDLSGNALGGATVEVRKVGTATKITETIYAGRTGATTLANPFTLGAGGEIEFWLDGPKRVDLLVTSGSVSETHTVDVTPSADEAYTPVINVKSYGAVGDGTANDGPALQAALDAVPSNGARVVGEGTFLTNQVLNVKSNTIFEGIGTGMTIKAGAASDYNWYGILRVHGVEGGASTPISNVILRGITVDANSQANTPAASFLGAQKLRVERCVFKNAPATAVANVLLNGGAAGGHGAYAVVKDAVFEDCEFGPSSNHGIRLGGGSGAVSNVIENLKFVRCSVIDNGQAGISMSVEAVRKIQNVLVDSCRFAGNGADLVGPTQLGDLDDSTRNGWVDLEVRGCSFEAPGSDFCGGVSDHKGRNIKIHHNTFKRGNFARSESTLWAFAIGEDRADAGGITARTWFAWIEDNYFEDCGPADFDSCRYVFVRRNVFYRNISRPLALFGQHWRTSIEDNLFLENNFGDLNVNTYDQAGLSCGRGVIIRRNTFRDDQGTQTQRYGVVEISGDPDESQATNVYEDNDWTNTTNPLALIAAYPHLIRERPASGTDLEKWRGDDDEDRIIFTQDGKIIFAGDTNVYRKGGNVLGTDDSLEVGGSYLWLNGQGFIQLNENTDPGSGGGDTARLFAKDNGAGKTQLCVQFNTGAVQVLATEP